MNSDRKDLKTSRNNVFGAKMERGSLLPNIKIGDKIIYRYSGESGVLSDPQEGVVLEIIKSRKSGDTDFIKVMAENGEEKLLDAFDTEIEKIFSPSSKVSKLAEKIKRNKNYFASIGGAILVFASIAFAKDQLILSAILFLIGSITIILPKLMTGCRKWKEKKER